MSSIERLPVEDTKRARSRKNRLIPCGNALFVFRVNELGFASLFFNLGRALAEAIAQVEQAGLHWNRFTIDFDFDHVRAVDRENAFDAFAVRDTTNRESFLDSRTLVADYDAGEDLDAFFVAFADFRVNANTVADAEVGAVGLKLGLCKRID